MAAFVKPYEAALKAEDKRVHPTYKLWRTVTGRSSASSPNVQQLGRDPLLRAFFSAPPGKELVVADYSAIEFRIAAFVAQEKGILDRYAADPNWDPHQWFGNRIGTDRQIAKSANFGLVFMAQAPTFQEYIRKTTGKHLSLSTCQDIRTEWHKTFPAFSLFYKDTAERLRRDGYVESFTGRRRHFGDPSLLRGKTWEESLREAVNFQVQSPSADIAFLGLAACHDEGMPINGFFHDAISFEFEPDEQETWNIVVCMTQVPKRVLREEFGVDLTVPLAIDFKVVKGE